jgi:hypothetical protein
LTFSVYFRLLYCLSFFSCLPCHSFADVVRTPLQRDHQWMPWIRHLVKRSEWSKSPGRRRSRGVFVSVNGLARRTRWPIPRDSRRFRHTRRPDRSLVTHAVGSRRGFQCPALVGSTRFLFPQFPYLLLYHPVRVRAVPDEQRRFVVVVVDTQTRDSGARRGVRLPWPRRVRRRRRRVTSPAPRCGSRRRPSLSSGRCGRCCCCPRRTTKPCGPCGHWRVAVAAGPSHPERGAPEHPDCARIPPRGD